jgi:hypothetical protein
LAPAVWQQPSDLGIDFLQPTSVERSQRENMGSTALPLAATAGLLPVSLSTTWLVYRLNPLVLRNKRTQVSNVKKLAAKVCQEVKARGTGSLSAITSATADVGNLSCPDRLGMAEPVAIKAASAPVTGKVGNRQQQLIKNTD